jgi:3-methyladenine DNA glycosylase AlkD
VPLTIFDYNDDLDLKLSINTNLLATSLINMGMGWLLSERDKIYNTIVDPTTIDDPNIP